MSDAKAYREKMKEKARRLANQKNEKVDASGWKEDDLDADVKTGMRPLSKRQFKNGGTVDGDNAAHHAGRARRKNGGKIGDAIVNRDVKEANKERDGKKHIGGMADGGRAKKLYGGGLYGMENTHAGGGGGGGPGGLMAGMVTGGGKGKGKGAAPGATSTTNQGYNKNIYADHSGDDHSSASGSSGPSGAGGYGNEPGLFKHGGKTKKANGGRAKKQDGGPMTVPAPDPIDQKIEELKAQIAALEAEKAQEGGGGGEDAAAPPPDDGAPQPPMKRGGRAKKASGGEAEAGNASLASKFAQSVKDSEAKAAAPRKDVSDENDSTIYKTLPVTGKNSGGRTKKNFGGQTNNNNNQAPAPNGPRVTGEKPFNAVSGGLKSGGRAKRADGGPVKGRTNINIIIAPQGQKDGSPQPPPPDAGGAAPPPPADMSGPPPAMPVPPDGGGAGPMAGPGGPPGAVIPPGLGQLLAEAKPRKDGGKVIHMKHGAGGGLGRLEKVQKYGAKA